MTRQLAFLGLLVFSCLYAATRGGRPEQIGTTTLFTGACLSVAVATPLGIRFQIVEAGILFVDTVILGIFLWLSYRSTRFWPIWVAAILGAEVAVHVMRATMPDLVPRAYMYAIALWSWVVQIILMAATWRHRSRLKHLGADMSWRL